jgi:hypothetical protein
VSAVGPLLTVVSTQSCRRDPLAATAPIEGATAMLDHLRQRPAGWLSPLPANAESELVASGISAEGVVDLGYRPVLRRPADAAARSALLAAIVAGQTAPATESAGLAASAEFGSR